MFPGAARPDPTQYLQARHRTGKLTTKPASLDWTCPTKLKAAGPLHSHSHALGAQHLRSLAQPTDAQGLLTSLYEPLLDPCVVLARIVWGASWGFFKISWEYPCYISFTQIYPLGLAARGLVARSGTGPTYGTTCQVETPNIPCYIYMTPTHL